MAFATKIPELAGPPLAGYIDLHRLGNTTLTAGHQDEILGPKPYAGSGRKFHSSCRVIRSMHACEGHTNYSLNRCNESKMDQSATPVLTLMFGVQHPFPPHVTQSSTDMQILPPVRSDSFSEGSFHFLEHNIYSGHLCLIFAL